MAIQIKSNDDGKTWDVNTNKVIWPFNEYQGNWDCAFSQISDGSILMHTRVCSFIKSSALKVNSPQSFGGTTPDKSERLKRQTGYSLLKSYDLGVTWDEQFPSIFNQDSWIERSSDPNSEVGVQGWVMTYGWGPRFILLGMPMQINYAWEYNPITKKKSDRRWEFTLGVDL